jgi:hypothetical protein
MDGWKDRQADRYPPICTHDSHTVSSVRLTDNKFKSKYFKDSNKYWLIESTYANLTLLEEGTSLLVAVIEISQS